MTNVLKYIAEPTLTFGYSQQMDDPREGLFYFGPLKDERHPKHIRVGVVGTPEGLSYYRAWAQKVCQFIPPARTDAAHHIAYPGFEACFQSTLPAQPTVELPISAVDISRTIRLSDRHHAIYQTVSLFEEPIKKKLREDDISVDIWFIVVPDEVYQYGRPLSRVPIGERVAYKTQLTAKIAKQLKSQPSLFEEDMQAATIYDFDLNFHHQLKARLLDVKAVAQIVRESSIVDQGELSNLTRRMQDPATIAWNLTTAVYYKAGGRPWKLSRLRDGVCYIGLVFKKISNDPQNVSACCGAQMFLDTGDGLVFKGALGDWYSTENHEYHLSEVKACDLIKMVLSEYEKINGRHPKEVFVHAKTRLNDAEWRGIQKAIEGKDVNIVGVKINRTSDVKLYRPGKSPVLRGTALILGDTSAYLWTSGYIPKLKTYAGREVPNALSVDVTRGQADLIHVLEDVMSLTKLNFNACIYADGLPVTLRFADAIGEILTARPEFDLPPLPFRHYI